MKSFSNLAITDPRDLRVGVSPKPLKTRRGMTIGGGLVYPELNFTLPNMEITADTMSAVLGEYRQMITGALTRAVELEPPGLVIEFETLPPMTQVPQWGIDVTKVLADATCDTWSNESVQNVKLLGGMAPTCYVEQLIYDCRIMNEALSDGKDSALLLRKWMVKSDAGLDPQAFVLTPQSSIEIAGAIVAAPNAYAAGKAAALTARSGRRLHRSDDGRRGYIQVRCQGLRTRLRRSGCER